MVIFLLFEASVITPMGALSLRLLKKDRRRTLIPMLLGFREQVLS